MSLCQRLDLYLPLDGDAPVAVDLLHGIFADDTMLLCRPERGSFPLDHEGMLGTLAHTALSHRCITHRIWTGLTNNSTV